MQKLQLLELCYGMIGIKAKYCIIWFGTFKYGNDIECLVS